MSLMIDNFDSSRSILTRSDEIDCRSEQQNFVSDRYISQKRKRHSIDNIEDNAHLISLRSNYYDKIQNVESTKLKNRIIESEQLKYSRNTAALLKNLMFALSLVIKGEGTTGQLRNMQKNIMSRLIQNPLINLQASFTGEERANLTNLFARNRAGLRIENLLIMTDNPYFNLFLSSVIHKIYELGVEGFIIGFVNILLEDLFYKTNLRNLNVDRMISELKEISTDLTDMMREYLDFDEIIYILSFLGKANNNMISSPILHNVLKTPKFLIKTVAPAILKTKTVRNNIFGRILQKIDLYYDFETTKNLHTNNMPQWRRIQDNMINKMIDMAINILPDLIPLAQSANECKMIIIDLLYRIFEAPIVRNLTIYQQQHYNSLRSRTYEERTNYLTRFLESTYSSIENNENIGRQNVDLEYADANSLSENYFSANSSIDSDSFEDIDIDLQDQDNSRHENNISTNQCKEDLENISNIEQIQDYVRIQDLVDTAIDINADTKVPVEQRYRHGGERIIDRMIRGPISEEYRPTIARLEEIAVEKAIISRTIEELERKFNTGRAAPI